MRIVIFSDTFPPDINGVATSTANLFKTLRDHKEDVIAVVPNHYSNKVTFEDNIIRIPGIELKKLYGYRAVFPWNQTAYKIVKEFKPDVIHIQVDAGVGQFGYMVAANLKVPAVYTYHTCYEDYTYYATKGMADRFAKSCVRAYTKFQSLRSYEFIAPSNKIKDYLRSIKIDDHISVLPTGIEFKKFSIKHRNLEETNKLKKSLGILPDEKILLSLGRVAKEKSIDFVIRGYAEFVKTHKNHKTKFLIVGDGPALNDLKELTSVLGIEKYVIFTGRVDPSLTQTYYWMGDIFASASITETQGLTFMEAMAASLIVLARYDDNLAGTIVDGKTGFFFETEEEFASVFESVLQLKKEEKEKIIEASLEYIDPYSMDNFYKNVIEVYKRAVKKYW